MSWKKGLCCVMIGAVLTGCQSPGAETAQKALDFRTGLLEAGGCGFTAAIEADFGDRVYNFTVACDYDAGGGAEITVLEPEEIAGIQARVSGDGVTVTFDTAELDFGQLANGNVSPVAASWLLGQCWTGAYVDRSGPDGDLARITYLDGYRDKELTVDTWLDGGTPVHAEIAYDGVRRLTLDLTDFQMKS